MFEIDQDVFTRRGFMAAGGLSVATAALPQIASGATAADLGGPGPASLIVSEQENIRTYVLAFKKGQELMATLLAFAKEHRVVSGSFMAIGAVSDAELAYFDPEAKKYRQIDVREQAEVASLIGGIALSDGEPFLHVHTVLGLRDGSTRAGHLLKAHVFPTLEVTLTAWSRPVHRTRDRDTGLQLLDLAI
jgi:predicted DNA-binding protein with PD1-like motif